MKLEEEGDVNNGTTVFRLKTVRAESIMGALCNHGATFIAKTARSCRYVGNVDATSASQRLKLI